MLFGALLRERELCVPTSCHREEAERASPYYSSLPESVLTLSIPHHVLVTSQALVPMLLRKCDAGFISNDQVSPPPRAAGARPLYRRRVPAGIAPIHQNERGAPCPPAHLTFQSSSVVLPSDWLIYHEKRSLKLSAASAAWRSARVPAFSPSLRDHQPVRQSAAHQGAGGLGGHARRHAPPAFGRGRGPKRRRRGGRWWGGPARATCWCRQGGPPSGGGAGPEI